MSDIGTAQGIARMYGQNAPDFDRTGGAKRVGFMDIPTTTTTTATVRGKVVEPSVSFLTAAEKTLKPQVTSTSALKPSEPVDPHSLEGPFVLETVEPEYDQEEDYRSEEEDNEEYDGEEIDTDVSTTDKTTASVEPREEVKPVEVIERRVVKAKGADSSEARSLRPSAMKTSTGPSTVDALRTVEPVAPDTSAVKKVENVTPLPSVAEIQTVRRVSGLTIAETNRFDKDLTDHGLKETYVSEIKATGGFVTNPKQLAIWISSQGYVILDEKRTPSNVAKLAHVDDLEIESELVPTFEPVAEETDKDYLEALF